MIDYGRLPPRGDGGISRVGQSSYGLAAPGRGLKAGLHHSGPRISPDSAPAPDERLATWVAAWVASRFDGAGEVLGLETCLYTNTADEEFVLDATAASSSAPRAPATGSSSPPWWGVRWPPSHARRQF